MVVPYLSMESMFQSFALLIALATSSPWTSVIAREGYAPVISSSQSSLLSEVAAANVEGEEERWSVCVCVCVHSCIFACVCL